MLGAAHATANPLTARYGITHGQAVGVMLPSVIRFNAQQCQEQYTRLIREIQPAVKNSQAGEALANLLMEWLGKSRLSLSLSELGVQEDTIEDLTADALEQWTGNFNPISLTKENVKHLYLTALTQNR